MEVRQVQLEEIEGVQALIDQYERPTAQRPGPEQIKEIYARIVGSGGCIIGAFKEREQLLGTCTVNICPNLSWSGRPYGIIENVIVDLDHRNQNNDEASFIVLYELLKADYGDRLFDSL